MSVGSIQNTLMAFSLFDAWAAGMDQLQKARLKEGVGSPLLAAVNDAFQAYVKNVETQNASMIMGAVTYALNSNGQGIKPVTTADIAPFLALNVLA